MYAGIGPRTNPLSIEVPYKAFMGPSVGDLFFTSQAELEDAIRRYAGRNVSFHCEDPEILEAHKGATTHEARRPPEAEILATDFALFLIAKYGLKGKLCHYSTREGLRKIVDAKSRQIDVTCEVTPHHLYFDETVLTEENRLWLQMNPPIRGRDDRVELIERLKCGDIDYLATDHAPHTVEEKQKGISGVPHLDTYGAFATWLMKEHGFSPQDIARVCSYNPGRFVNDFSEQKFGRIEEGYVGSLTVIDMSNPTRVSSDRLKTKCGWSPFKGVVFPGRVASTVVRGMIYS